MAKEFSPEEKLLNLIKRKKGTSQSQSESAKKPPAAPKETPATSKRTVSSIPALDLQSVLKLEHIRILNTALLAMLVVVILYFFIDIFLIPPQEVAVLEELPVQGSHLPEMIELEPYSYYAKNLATKQVFKPLVQEAMSKPGQEIPIEDIVGSLTLVGIVSGQTPQAIIEDTKQKKRFFLKEGQSSGGILLKTIDDGAVTVVYKGEEFTLSL